MKSRTRVVLRRGAVVGDRPPALLLGSLNILRPLGMGGIRVVVGVSSDREIAHYSRYACGHCRLPPWSSPTEEIVDALLQAGSELAGLAGTTIPLYYSSDDPLRLLHLAGDELAGCFSFLTNQPELGLSLLEKDRFSDLAREKGLPVPWATPWTPAEEPRIAEFRESLIVKPRSKSAWHESAVYGELLGHRGKGKVYDSGAALLADPLAARYREALLVQEYVPGGEEDIHSFHGFSDEKGEILACFAGKKVRSYPRIAGESSFLELQKNDQVIRLGSEIVSKLGLRGVYKLDFKRHRQTGRYYLMEINARYNLWNYLGAVNGVNIPALAYDYLVRGRRPAAAPYGTGCRWLHLVLDFQAYRDLARAGELTLGGWLRSILNTRRIHPVFSWKDPLPLAVLIARFLLRRLGLWRSTGSSRTSTATGKR